MNEDIRHQMDVYMNHEDTRTKYMTVFLPDLGNMTITYETRESSGGEARPVVSVDFDVDMIDIIDKYGTDREIQ